MTLSYIVVEEDPEISNKKSKSTDSVVSRAPWLHKWLYFGISVRGRQVWGGSLPTWSNGVIYYNTDAAPLASYLNTIVVHHTDNARSILSNEFVHRARGYVALGYHFFIDRKGSVYEGRPLEIMGSHAGAPVTRSKNPPADPDWGKVGIVLQGDYEHADDWLFSLSSPPTQLRSLKSLLTGLRANFPGLTRLLLHREVLRGGKPTNCPGDHLTPIVIRMRSQLGFSR